MSSFNRGSNPASSNQPQSWTSKPAPTPAEAASGFHQTYGSCPAQSVNAFTWDNGIPLMVKAMPFQKQKAWQTKRTELYQQLREKGNTAETASLAHSLYLEAASEAGFAPPETSAASQSGAGAKAQ